MGWASPDDPVKSLGGPLEEGEEKHHGIGDMLLFAALYGSVAAGSAFGASVTTGWAWWVLAVVAAFFSAITAWMLPFCAFALFVTAISKVPDRFLRRWSGM
jgi:hypothetical protein